MSKRTSWENLRPWPVYLTAAMLPISLAATNLFRLVMVLFALVTLYLERAESPRQPAFSRLRTPLVVCAMLAALALSLAYTSAPLPEALVDISKYGKLVLIPVAVMLLRTRREALVALALYGIAESFILGTSYLLAAGFHPPWVIKPLAIRQSVATVSSGYLDQSIMTVGFASLAWHLRHDFPGQQGRKVAIAIVALCALNVLFLLPGRSGQVALLAAVTFALLRALPRRRRAVALLVPLLLVAAVVAASPHFRARAAAVVSEAQAYSQGDSAPTSSAVRLNYWHRSLQALSERPLTGFGVGSWNTEYRRLEGTTVRPDALNVRNPHQEYLLWGVQLGFGGMLLLVAFLATMARDASRFERPERDAAQSLVLILAVVCLFNSTLFDALIGDYFCVLIGILFALGLSAADAVTPVPPRPPVAS